MEAPVVTFDEIDSTNAEARRRAEAGDAGPVWLMAERQSAGKGRRGRAWSTEPGNLAATLLITTDHPPARIAQLSFVAALAVCDVVSAYVPNITRVKWPNDVMIGHGKASGILIESGRRPDGRHWAAIGIGVNLAHHPTEVERPATHVGAHISGPPPEPGDALLKLIFAFRDWFEVWDAQGFPGVIDGWIERAYGLGEAATVRLPNETLHGLIEGLDVDGALRLRLPDGGIRRITAGDVFLGDG
jgi:BirA family transcriptional regulator, biotin operon repressor / biotin---[acetyl-CoA-carboxylase] ligase